MNVLITNMTDAPGHPKGPMQIDIHNRTISPGDQLRLPADLVNKKIKELEEQGLIAIGQMPAWYLAAKRRPSRALSQEERDRRQVPPPTPVIQLKPAKDTKAVEIEEPGRRTNKG